MGVIEKINKIKTDIKSPNTPEILDGIERKITYEAKNYHSGKIWGGVTNGSDGILLVGSKAK